MTFEPEVDRTHAVNTPDVTLTYVAWLDRARRDPWLHLHCDIRSLYEMKLWDFGEDGSCYHNYRSQHESSRKVNYQFPASRDRSTRYFEEGSLPLHRPSNPAFIQQSWTYPLIETRRIFTCTTCAGEGQVICHQCSGNKKCSWCRGRGRRRVGKHLQRCYTCSGTGRCVTCEATGLVRCETCKGERELLTYTSKDYRWWHDEDEETVLSALVDRPGVKSLVVGVRKRGGSVGLAHYTPHEVLRTTGVFNSRIAALLRRAEDGRRQLEARIAGRSDLVLFQEIRLQYVPLLYLNLFAGRKYGQYFVAGTGDQHAVRFSLPISLTKSVAWAFLATFVLQLLFWAVSPLLMLLNFAILASLVGKILHETLRANAFAHPRRWVVFDDAQCGAWQFTYLYAQAISRHRVARILDPWFTTLLEPPRLDSAQGRNSFLCTIEDLDGDLLDGDLKKGLDAVEDKLPVDEADGELARVSETGMFPIAGPRSVQFKPMGIRRRTELLVVGNRSQRQFVPDVQSVTAEAERFILMSNSETIEALTARIKEIMGRRDTLHLKPCRITVVTDISNPDVEPLQLADIEHLGRDNNGFSFDMLALPISRLCEESRMGDLSEESEEVCRQLLNFGGYHVATEEMNLTVDEQIEVESAVPNANYGETAASSSGLEADLNRYLLDPDANVNLHRNQVDGK